MIMNADEYQRSELSAAAPGRHADNQLAAPGSRNTAQMADRTLRRKPARAPAGTQAQSVTTTSIVSPVIAAFHNRTIGMTNHIEHARPRTARDRRSGAATVPIHRDSVF
jgi:hypothetical protein